MPQTMSRSLVVSSLVVVLSAAPVLAGADPTDPPQGVFSDDWYVLMFGGQQAGYVHSTMERRGDRVHSQEEVSLTLRRAGQPLEIKMRSSRQETVAGRPVSFDSATTLASAEMRTQGEIADGKVKLKSTQFGVTSEAEYEITPDALMIWGLRLVGLKHGFEPGTKYTVKVYEPSQSPGAAIPTTVEILGRESIELFGRKYDAVKSRISMQLGGAEFPSETWMDVEGKVLRTKLQMTGMEIEQLLADKERALNRGGSVELMIDTLIHPDRVIEPRKARQVRYRLTLAEDDRDLGDLPETDLQRVVRRADRSVELLVRRQDHQALAADASAVGKPAEGMDEYLAAGPMINWQDPVVLKMAARAKGDETNAYRLANKLRRYVTDVIAEKNLDVGFATASDVARNRQGDCSEHGVLLAALGRANGIPSRVAVGLIYVDRFAGQQGVFGFHMWTQMHLGGQWVDLDAAMGETDCNPTHIAIAVSSLQDEGLMEVVGPLLQVIGNLKIEVLEETG